MRLESNHEQGSNIELVKSPVAEASSGTSTDGEKQPGPIAPEDDYPEGGREAWLVAAGTGCILFCTLGYTNSFGVFQAYYMLHQLKGESPDAISWIGSTQAYLIFASGAIGGPLFDRFGAWVLRPAALLYIFAVMMTSLCTSYWQFMLAQGILTGLANGLVMFPAMSATPQYFHKNRGAAMGIAITGSSLGAIVFPLVLSKLLNDSSVGFGWAVRVTGFMMIPIMAFAVVTVKARLPPRATNFFLWSAFKMPLYNILISASFFLFIGMFTPMFYLPTYGIYRGMNETLASYLVAMINGASIPGRIIPGILGDKLGRINALFAAGALTGMLIFCWPTATSTAGIVVFSVAFGFTSGAIISASSVVISLCPKDPKDIGTYMGMGMALAALATLMGPPANGALLHAYGTFDQVSWFSGATTLVGAILVLIAKTQTPQGIFGRI